MFLFSLIAAQSSFAAEALKFDPVFRVRSPGRYERLITSSEIPANGLKPTNEAFLAVSSSTWPQGLVPIFRIEENGSFELRRTPPRGQENYTEPLFFALPCDDEADAAKIAGTWSCVATNQQQSKHYPAWELTMDWERIVGRFDQRTEYRFAFVSGGAFRSNRIELKIDYLNDHYTLAGEWRDGRLNGTWRHDGEADHGTWEATRPDAAPAIPKNLKPVALYEWRRASEKARRYSVEAIETPGWERAVRPIGRVWQAK